MDVMLSCLWKQASSGLRSWSALVASFLLFIQIGAAAVHAQVATPTVVAPPAPLTPEQLAQVAAAEDVALNAQVEAILAQMSPADRVGQLFMVTFAGNNTSFNSEISRLIYDYRIGGVVLSPQNRNFSNALGVDTPRQVATLVNQLQALAYGVLLPNDQALLYTAEDAWPPPGLVSLTSQSGAPPPNLPLLIAMEQWGDGTPYTSLRRGFTPLPSQMALGATWNIDLARRVGQIVGRELRAVGVNMLLGPNLDVFDQPRADSVGALSLHSFGGSPYWVGQMGRAYIAGVHEGANGQVVTMARHFPGQGNIDRLPEQEIATVQLGIEEIRSTALAPFRSVTRGSSIVLSRTGDVVISDGLMTSHMRYSALPGRATPISLGPELSMTLEQEGFTEWHANGGILMSNAIGVPAIQRYYDPTLSDFTPRRVALDVFSAGHDLIYLDNLSLDGDWATEYAAIQAIIGFFQDRYQNDADFAAQVDASVRRILRLKLRLYGPSYLLPTTVSGNNGVTLAPSITETMPITVTPTLTLPIVSAPQVLVSESNFEVLTGTLRADAVSVIGQVARESLTLLYPDVQDLAAALPNAPQSEDRLLIFSDSRLFLECPQCTAETMLPPDEMATIINRLYGAEATNQVLVENIESQTFADLDQLLRANVPTPEQAATPATGVNSVAPLTTTATGPSDATDVETGEVISATAETRNKIARLEQLIDDSTWIIFMMLDVNPTAAPTSDVLKRFLSTRSEELRGKNVIVFSLNAPYFLDATEISKLSAYFGIYGKTRPFLESTVRALFRSYTPTGAPPVSVPGTPYGSLSERLQPDAQRPVPIRLSVGESELVVSPEAETLPVLNVGDVLRLRVGPVLDRNGRPVPDGTTVSFELHYEGETVALSIESANTRSGVALREVPIERAGTLQIRAMAGSATSGEPVALDVQNPATTVTPAESPPLTPTLDLTTTTTTTTGTIENQTAPPLDPDSLAATGRRINGVTLLIALVTIVITLSLLLIAQVQILPRQVLVHNMLWAIIFGLIAYILYGLGLLPGVGLLQRRLDVLGPAVVVFVAMLLPLLWLQLRTEQLQ